MCCHQTKAVFSLAEVFVFVPYYCRAYFSDRFPIPCSVRGFRFLVEQCADVLWPPAKCWLVCFTSDAMLHLRVIFLGDDCYERIGNLCTYYTTQNQPRTSERVMMKSSHLASWTGPDRTPPEWQIAPAFRMRFLLCCSNKTLCTRTRLQIVAGFSVYTSDAIRTQQTKHDNTGRQTHERSNPRVEFVFGSLTKFSNRCWTRGTN